MTLILDARLRYFADYLKTAAIGVYPHTRVGTGGAIEPRVCYSMVNSLGTHHRADGHRAWSHTKSQQAYPCGILVPDQSSTWKW